MLSAYIIKKFYIRRSIHLIKPFADKKKINDITL